MTVQTKPDIHEMSAAQQIELMEALWKSMGERSVNSEPPEWHLRYLEGRSAAVASGDDSFIDLDDLENGLRPEFK